MDYMTFMIVESLSLRKNYGRKSIFVTSFVGVTKNMMDHAFTFTAVIDRKLQSIPNFLK